PPARASAPCRTPWPAQHGTRARRRPHTRAGSASGAGSTRARGARALGRSTGAEDRLRLEPFAQAEHALEPLERLDLAFVQLDLLVLRGRGALGVEQVEVGGDGLAGGVEHLEQQLELVFADGQGAHG